MSPNKPGLASGKAIAIFPDHSLTKPSQPGSITAGEWKDLEHWDYWKKLLEHKDWKDKPAYWKIFPVDDYTITLTDTDSNAVYDANVSLEDIQGNIVAQGKTDNKGKCVLFPQLIKEPAQKQAAYQVKVLYDNQVFYLGMIHTQNRQVAKQINTGRKSFTNLDIMFVAEATHSMHNELSYLKTHLNDMVGKVKSQTKHLNIRLASSFYINSGTESVAQSLTFTNDVDKLIKKISLPTTEDTGNFPEAAQQVIFESIIKQNWSPKAVNRIMFLMIDAPAAYSPQTISRFQKIAREATLRGIRIIPIASGTVDKDTEFLMRFLAISTNGTFAFVTKPSITVHPKQELTVGKYVVENLDELLTRLMITYSRTE
jgi:hypothetical protein